MNLESERARMLRWLQSLLGVMFVIVVAALARAADVKKLPATSSDAPCITTTTSKLPASTPGCTPATINRIPLTMNTIAVNGVWCAWGACSGGSQTRTCACPAPSGGGAACVGPSSQACGGSICGANGCEAGEDCGNCSTTWSDGAGGTPGDCAGPTCYSDDGTVVKIERCSDGAILYDVRGAQPCRGCSTSNFWRNGATASCSDGQSGALCQLAGNCDSGVGYCYHFCTHSGPGSYIGGASTCPQSGGCGPFGGGCACTAWTNAGCGAGGCAAGEQRQTRSCSPPAGCLVESQCVADAACVCDPDGSYPIGSGTLTLTGWSTNPGICWNGVPIDNFTGFAGCAAPKCCNGGQVPFDWRMFNCSWSPDCSGTPIEGDTADWDYRCPPW